MSSIDETEKEDTTSELPRKRQRLDVETDVENNIARTETDVTETASSAETIDQPLKQRSSAPYTLKASIQAHDKAISTVRYSPDGRFLASASSDATVKIWHTQTGELDQILHGHAKGISDVAWSSTSDLLVSASDDRTLRVWSLRKGTTLRLLRGHTSFVFCCEFNEAGNLIASGSFDESIKIWDVRGGTCLKTLPAHSDPVLSVKFNLDGSLLVSCSHDGLIRIWDTQSGQCLKTFSDQDSPAVSYVAFSPNGRFIVSCTLDSTIRIWDYINSAPLKTFKGHLNVKYSINAEMSNEEVVLGGEDGKVTVWDTQSREVKQVISCSQDVVLSISKITIDGRKMISAAGLDKVIRVYQAS